VTDDRRVALVTGANRGIGRELVRQLIEHGFRTILTARDDKRGRAAADELGAEFLRLDVADDAGVDRCFQTVEERHGRLDVLINNAAIDYDTWQRGVDADLAVVHQAFETNLFGAWRCCLPAVSLMQRNAWGRIVNVSSEGGSLASMGGGTAAYSTSKAALNALTRVLAAELRGSGILVNAVCPGWNRDRHGRRGRPAPRGRGRASPLGGPARRRRADRRVLPRWEAAPLVSRAEDDRPRP
jgi:NAD(P)-dependent dehydrogenase (short-subunit alcohol dehydrogenase family)